MANSFQMWYIGYHSWWK